MSQKEEPEGRAKNHREDITCKIADRILLPVSVPVGRILPHSLGDCYVIYFSEWDFNKLH